jgi:hypothetical protein
MAAQIQTQTERQAPGIGTRPSAPASDARHVLFVLASFAALMGSIDSTIVAAAVPQLTTALNAPLAWVAWTLTVYQLSSPSCCRWRASCWRWGSLLPPGGSRAVGLLQAPWAGIWTGVSLLTSNLDEIYHQWTRAVHSTARPLSTRGGARTAKFADIDWDRFQLVEVPSDSPRART